MSRVFTVRRDQVSWTESGNEIVVLNLSTSHYYALNESGSVLWAKLVDGASAEELALALVDAYGIDRTVAENDVVALLAELSGRDIVDEASNVAG